MSSAFSFKLEDNNIGQLYFHLPGEKINKLSTPVLNELNGLLDNLAKRTDIKVLVIRSNKEDVFIAGADVKEIQNVDTEGAEKLVRLGHSTLNKYRSISLFLQ